MCRLLGNCDVSVESVMVSLLLSVMRGDEQQRKRKMRKWAF